jgi:translation elongation factor EF-G
MVEWAKQPGVPYRESIQRHATGERKYIRFFAGRGHFAHLRLEVTPSSAKLCSVTRSHSLEIPDSCYHASRAAIFKRFETGPIHGYQMIGVDVNLIQGTYLPQYSYPDAFAIVAEMALDEALSLASLAVLEPWIGMKLQLERSSLSEVLVILTDLVRELPVILSTGEILMVNAEVPARLLPAIRKKLNLRRVDTFSLRDEFEYRIAFNVIPKSGQPGIPLNDWT